MRSRRLNPTLLVTLVVALAAVRPMRLMPCAHGDADPRAHGAAARHHHEHSHGDLTHTHHHHHHAGDSPDEHDHDHGALDHSEEAPKARWSAPRRSPIQPPPVAAPSAVLPGVLPSEWNWLRRGKPPPRVDPRAPQLTSLRTIVLRL